MRKFSQSTLRIIKQTTYSWKEVSPYFTPEEIFSPDTIKLKAPINIDALKHLNIMREFLGTPVLVNHGPHKLRGVRSLREQMALISSLGAAQNSQHIAGAAFDISTPDLPHSELLEVCIAFSWSVIIVYDGFLHVDLRPYWATGNDIGKQVFPRVFDFRKTTKGAYAIEPYAEIGKRYAEAKTLARTESGDPELAERVRVEDGDSASSPPLGTPEKDPGGGGQDS